MRLPKEIMPIVDMLRREVPAPTGSLSVSRDLREDPCPRWGTERGFCCPLGLHKHAMVPCPYDSGQFLPARPEVGLSGSENLKEEDIKAFADYWDSLPLDKAEKVAREIWPE
jgi:hypothetical protein